MYVCMYIYIYTHTYITRGAGVPVEDAEEGDGALGGGYHIMLCYVI